MSPFRHHFLDVDRFTELCYSAQIPLSENRQAKLPISTDHAILLREEGSFCLCIVERERDASHALLRSANCAG